MITRFFSRKKALFLSPKLVFDYEFLAQRGQGLDLATAYPWLTGQHIHTHIYIYVYKHVFLPCVCPEYVP